MTFIVAFIFPNNFRNIFGEGTINPAFLPRYAALHARGEHTHAARFANDEGRADVLWTPGGTR